MDAWLREAVASVLQKSIGAFVHGIDAKHLGLNASAGDVVLDSLQLKLEAFEAFDLPLSVVRGTLGAVRVKVPWRNLGSEPMVVTVDRLYLLLAPKDGTGRDAEAERRRSTNAQREQLAAWEEGQDKKKEGAIGAFVGEQVEKLVRKVLQKLEISLTNVHIRVQHGSGASTEPLGDRTSRLCSTRDTEELP